MDPEPGLACEVHLEGRIPLLDGPYRGAITAVVGDQVRVEIYEWINDEGEAREHDSVSFWIDRNEVRLLCGTDVTMRVPKPERSRSGAPAEGGQ